jgi:hypothetical protein
MLLLPGALPSQGRGDKKTMDTEKIFGQVSRIFLLDDEINGIIKLVQEKYREKIGFILMPFGAETGFIFMESSNKSKKSVSSIVLYTASIVVALIAIALLVIRIIMFNQSVDQYVAQGYPVAIVIKQLIPSQLLPAIFDTISVYGGIALILFSAGMINKKITKCLDLLNKNEVLKIASNDNNLVDDSIKIKDSDSINKPSSN